MMNPQLILQQAMRMNPNLANNPQAQEIIQVLMNGDAQKGQQMAQNYCKSYNVTPEQGVQQAQSFLKQRFHF